MVEKLFNWCQKRITENLSDDHDCSDLDELVLGSVSSKGGKRFNSQLKFGGEKTVLSFFSF